MARSTRLSPSRQADASALQLALLRHLLSARARFDVLGPPALDEMVLCIDETTGMQAFERNRRVRGDGRWRGGSTSSPFAEARARSRSSLISARTTERSSAAARGRSFVGRSDCTADAGSSSLVEGPLFQRWRCSRDGLERERRCREQRSLPGHAKARTSQCDRSSALHGRRCPSISVGED